MLTGSGIRLFELRNAFASSMPLRTAEFVMTDGDAGLRICDFVVEAFGRLARLLVPRSTRFTPDS